MVNNRSNYIRNSILAVKCNLDFDIYTDSDENAEHARTKDFYYIVLLRDMTWTFVMLKLYFVWMVNKIPFSKKVVTFGSNHSIFNREKC